MYIKLTGRILWHYNIVAKNGQIVVTSETYFSKGNCVRAAKAAGKALKLEVR